MSLLDTSGPHAGIPTLAEETRLIPEQERVFKRWLKDDRHDDEAERVKQLMRSAYLAGVRTYGG